jgi:tetratricopeptide (TPR) repeat protein
MAAAARKAGNLEKAEKYNNMLVAAKIITAKEKAIIFAPRPEAAAAKETGKRARSDVKQRMENIVFPEVDFKDADIFTVIRYLLQNSRRYDPDFEGVAIVSAFTKKQADGVPKITIKRTNISLANLLDDICRDAGMKYRIEQGMAVLSVAVTSAVIPQKCEIQKWQQENDMTLSNLPEGKITRKLNSIIIPHIEFEDLSIPAAIKILREQSKKFDPEWEGVNIFLRLKEGEDNEAVVNLVLTNKKLSEVIYFFCRAAKLKFQVEKYAVVISNRDNSATAPDQDSTNDKPAFSETAILALKGGRLSDEEAAKLEKQVALNPEDLISLTELLGYYFLKSHTDETVKQKREKYILWLIKNHPDAEVLGIPYGQIGHGDNYPAAKKLWMEQIEKHPDDLKVVGNFARSVVRKDIDLAIKYYKKAKSLDPKKSHTWDFWLGSAYDLKSMSSNRSEVKQDSEVAREALSNSEIAMEYYESAFTHSPEKERSNMLPYMAQSALKAGKLDKAGEYANKMLAAAKTETKNGKLVYYGNFILGMLAVKKGDIDAAGKYLLEAGKSTGSATLNSFGPDMSLARELLAKGKRDIVLEFLKECSKFWKSSNGICDQWIKEMENGGTPDFSNISKAKPESNEAAKPEAAFSMQDRAVKMAQTAAGEWLALVDDGKYPESWTAASTLFKSAVTADTWTQMLKSGQTPFGKMLSRKLKNAVYRTSLPGAPDGQYVVIQYDTTFENKKDAVETVTPMLDKDGQWRVSGYYIK